MTERALVMPGTFANYYGQRWVVGAVGVTGGERYYWLTRGGVVLMAPATMVKPWAPALPHAAPVALWRGGA